MRPAGAVVEGMNAFDLVVQGRHRDERIDVWPDFVGVDDLGEIAHQPHDVIGILRRSVHDLASRRIFECGSGLLPKSGIVAFKHLLDRADVVRREYLPLLQQVIAFEQGVRVISDFLGLRRDEVALEQFGPVQFVRRRNDAFNFGAVLGFLKTEGPDENVLVRDGPGKAFQDREFPVRVVDAFQDSDGFQVRFGR